MSKVNGYTGKYIRVNLTTGDIKVLPVPEELIKNYLGGSGWGTKILWDEVAPEADPLSPENKLVFATGPLTGTRWPTSGRLAVVAKSPLTGIYGDANAGGHFTPDLKNAGYDMVIFEGKAEKPVYLYINNDKIELRDASHLWGKVYIDTEEEIRKELGDEKIKVAAIGPAGENLVRFAAIMVTFERAVARAGMGAVMGSKKLKALAVRGTATKPEPADKEAFTASAKNATKTILANEFTEGEHMLGTPGLVNIVNETGRFPTKNLQMGSYEDADMISGETLHEKYFVKHKACFNCPIGCDKEFRVDEGEFAGTVTTSLEYETLSSLGSRCMNNNLASIIKANVICDSLGMDTISAGGVVSFAMECWEKGIITAKDTNGLDLSWGNYQSILKLLQMIAYRQGIGDILAEGSARAAKKFGKGAEKYVMAIKGMEISAQDGRAQQSMGLAQATSSRGADHLKGFPTIDETGYAGPAAKRYGEECMPEIIDGTQSKHKPLVVKDGEEFCAIIDSAGICKFGTMFPPAVYWDQLAEGISLMTGMKIGIPELKRIGERITNLQRCYNILHGISAKDDVQPERLLKEKSPSGKAKGHVIYLEPMIKEYYKLRDWDPVKGYPTRKKLEELGLGSAADRIGV